MTPKELEELQKRFERGEISVGIEHLIPTVDRKPMPTKVPTPPPPIEGEKKQ
jgi:hypothetical protein